MFFLNSKHFETQLSTSTLKSKTSRIYYHTFVLSKCNSLFRQSLFSPWDYSQLKKKNQKHKNTTRHDKPLLVHPNSDQLEDIISSIPSIVPVRKDQIHKTCQDKSLKQWLFISKNIFGRDTLFVLDELKERHLEEMSKYPYAAVDKLVSDAALQLDFYRKQRKQKLYFQD